jgi:hypothetical protein
MTSTWLPNNTLTMVSPFSKFSSNRKDFAMKLMQQLLRFSGGRFEMSKEFQPVEPILSGRVWDKIVAIQYNIYSRLKSGAKIAGNGIILLQLRVMFVALMMSCKAEGPRARTPQNMGRAWLSVSSLNFILM